MSPGDLIKRITHRRGPSHSHSPTETESDALPLSKPSLTAAQPLAESEPPTSVGSDAKGITNNNGIAEIVFDPRRYTSLLNANASPSPSLSSSSSALTDSSALEPTSHERQHTRKPSRSLADLVLDNETYDALLSSTSPSSHLSPSTSDPSLRTPSNPNPNPNPDPSETASSPTPTGILSVPPPNTPPNTASESAFYWVADPNSTSDSESDLDPTSSRLSSKSDSDSNSAKGRPARGGKRGRERKVKLRLGSRPEAVPGSLLAVAERVMSGGDHVSGQDRELEQESDWFE